MDLANVRPKPRWLDFLPVVGRGTCHAIYPYIYVSRPIYRNISGTSPDAYAIALLLHEQEHIKRMQKYSVLKWYVQYFCSRAFRLNEELAATEIQLQHIRHEGLTFDLQRRARQLSGSMYLWAGSYKNTLARLQHMWDTL